MKQAYVVRWQSPSMAGMAFWYYMDLTTAKRIAGDLRASGTRAYVEGVTVPDDTFLGKDETSTPIGVCGHVSSDHASD